MLTYSADNRNGESLYEYYYTCIKNDILAGRLPADTRLPSRRAFADNNGISTVTVENAYGQLMAEGYIYAKPRSGFYVSRISLGLLPKDSLSQQIPAEAGGSGSENVNLISNHTSLADFPFSVWAKIMRQILSEQEAGVLRTPPTGGVTELREAIAGHLKDFRGIRCSPEQIIIGAGTEYLYNLLVQLLGRERTYGLENPGSLKIRNIYEALGVKIRMLAMDREGILLSPENLAGADILLLSPSHHFPTGTVTGIGRRYGLLQWANEQKGRYIIEDDYDSEFRLAGKPIPSLYAMDTTGRVIYLNTFTKTLASTIRISYMVLPQPLLEEFYRKLGFYACTVSNFEQYTLARFISGGYFDKHINRMRNRYRSVRDELIGGIRGGKLAGRVKIREEDSGLHFLLHIQSSLPDAALKEQARENGVTIAFLSDYFADDRPVPAKYTRTAIVNYSGLPGEKIAETVEALARAWG